MGRRFLNPVLELSRGLQSFQARDFSFRLEKIRNDEFGDLVQVFNSAMMGLSDLEVGRIVQTNLLPKEELSVGDFRIFGRTTFASEMTGDYFDVEKLPDGKILILVGDVTGHGYRRSEGGMEGTLLLVSVGGLVRAPGG